MKDLEKFTIEKIKHLTMAIDQSAFTAIRDRLIEEKAMAEIALKALQARPVGYLFVSPDGGIAYSISSVEFEGVKLVGAVYDYPPINSQKVPDGWKLVPVIPTDKMLLNAMIAGEVDSILPAISRAESIWEQFLAAAPNPE